MPEKEQLALPRDALTVFGQYVRFPLFASGLSDTEWIQIQNPSIELRTRWNIVKSRLPAVRHTSFARVARMVLEHFWGIGEITDENLEELSARIAADSHPGLYHKVLREHCRISHIYDQDSGHNGHDSPVDLDVFDGQDLLLPVVALIDIVPDTDETVHRLAGLDGFQTLPSYLEWAEARLEAMAQRGAIAVKTFSLGETTIDYNAAASELEDLRRKNLHLHLVHKSHLQLYPGAVTSCRRATWPSSRRSYGFFQL